VNYAEQQRKPGKHLIALGIVVLLHVLLGWAFVSGLAKRVVDVVKGPIETKIIEEQKPPPPPPENLPPPPKFAPPPPSFVPPPEVVVNPPPTPAPTITTTQTPPPAEPVHIAPPPKPEAPPAVAARPAQIQVSTCDKPEYPAAAVRAEATGTTRIQFTVDGQGRVSKAEIVKSAGVSREHKMLDRAAVDALSKCRFTPGIDATGKAVGGTTIVDYDWNLN
jgi:protein TonB